jgi:hypothetical protein
VLPFILALIFLCKEKCQVSNSSRAPIHSLNHVPQDFDVFLTVQKLQFVSVELSRDFEKLWATRGGFFESLKILEISCTCVSSRRKKLGAYLELK